MLPFSHYKKTMKVSDIISCIEKVAPPSYQESYDNSGLIVGDRNVAINGVLVCLDSTEDVVEEAISMGYNMIVAHHPIIFGGLKKINGNNYVERTIIKAIKNDIAIYAVHTNLDNVMRMGVNSKIAEKLGLENCSILSPKKGLLKKLYTYAPHAAADKVREALFAAGAGDIGNYSECSFSVEGIGTFKGSDESNPVIGERGIRHSEPEQKIEVILPAYRESAIISALFEAHPYEEVAYEIVSLDNSFNEIGSGLIGELQEPLDSLSFLHSLKEKMNCECVRHTEIHKKEIKKIALCGGSGSFLLKQAIGAGADVFVSADFKYHEFFDAEKRIIIADIGHFETEQFTIELICEIISQKFPTFALRQSSVKTNPLNYI
jgi:dinuclear metal center YbgI/SA1388 family protein